MITKSADINNIGHVTFAGHDTVELAEKYGTPLYLMDEKRIRDNCRLYVNALSESFEKSMALYASKAFCCKRIIEIVSEEGMAVDVVSCGEMYTALQAGVSPEKIFFHGNSKTDEEIEYAINHRIGYFIVDNTEELEAIDRFASHFGVKQKVLLRLTPGIDPHTFKAVTTGKINSKFGVAIVTGQAEAFTEKALHAQNLKLCGFHCHIGSQIFKSMPFSKAGIIMLNFISDIFKRYGYIPDMLDIGGGFGVRYLESDPCVDIAQAINAVARIIKLQCRRLEIPVPTILMEPGRSISAEAGATVYTVNSVKTIPRVRSYIAVDGGMTDNPRYALYGALYTAAVANRADEPETFKCTVAGRCCESGDILLENVMLQRPQRGDKLIVFITGAYNYSMASNYNGVCRPPVVMLNGENDYVAVRRETFEDLASRDM